MRKIIAAVVLAASLPGCNPITAFTEGMKYMHAVEDDLQQEAGVKPQVGFNWNNGRLRSVTVIFPGVYDSKPLGELAATVRAVVIREFKQTPDSIVLGFSLDK